MNYIEWTKESIEEFLSTQTMRRIEPLEYFLLIKFIKQIRPDTVIDVGSYLGHSGYILATCCDSIKDSYSIENIDRSDYYPKEEAEKEDHGKFLHPSTTFLTHGYENGILDGIIKKHPNAFVLYDAGKNTLKIMDQIRLSYKNKIKYIAFHDSGKIQRSVRRAIKRVEQVGMYKIIKEDIDSCPKKGISILELMKNEEDGKTVQKMGIS